MKQILVTGAAGTLGQQVVKTLAAQTDIMVRLMRHRESSASIPQVVAKRMNGVVRRVYRASRPTPQALPAAQWVQADLLSGEGLNDAVRDIDVIIHCAWGIGKLLEVARSAQVSHIVYISIVGCDRIPLFFYRQKVAEEEAIKKSGIPWSILRATQFHALIDLIVRGGSKLPGVTLLPTDWHFQPIDECEVGRRIAELALASPIAAIQQIGGPQVLSLGELAQTWVTLRQKRSAVLPLWIPGKIAAGYRRGNNTCGLDLPHGEITWAQWVQQTYQKSFATPY